MSEDWQYRITGLAAGALLVSVFWYFAGVIADWIG